MCRPNFNATEGRGTMTTAELLDREACEHLNRETMKYRRLDGEVVDVYVCKDCGKNLGQVD